MILYGQNDAVPGVTANNSEGNQKVSFPYFAQQTAGARIDGANAAPPHWYQSPEWWLFIIAIPTLIVVGCQAFETRRAVEASRKNAEVLISSERAWVLVDIGKLPDLPDANRVEFLFLYPLIENRGKTVARLSRIRGIVKLVPEGENLPTAPEYPLGQGFDHEVDLILPPHVPIRPKLIISGQEFLDVQAHKKILYVHGSIEYRDIGGRERVSNYCYAYVIRRGFSPDVTGFYPVLNASAAYTECT
jgi:hypothetical protein